MLNLKPVFVQRWKYEAYQELKKKKRSLLFPSIPEENLEMNFGGTNETWAKVETNNFIIFSSKAWLARIPGKVIKYKILII